MTRIPFENIVSTIKKIATTTSSIINTTLTTFSTTTSSTFPTTTTLRTTTRAITTTTTTTTTTTMATTTVAPLPESHFFLFIGVFILICILLVGLGVGSFYNLTLLMRKKSMGGIENYCNSIFNFRLLD